VVSVIVALAVVGLVAVSSTVQAATVTGVRETHRVHLVKPDRFPQWQVVIVRSSAHTHAIQESIEEPGGVGGTQLRMYYHTHHAAIDNMRECGRQTTRYPFCLRFGPTITTTYWPNDEDWPLGFRQNLSCSEDTDAWYYCKFSRANYASHDLAFEAVAKRSIIITKGRPDWTIAGHGGAMVIENDEYTVYDSDN